MPNKFNMIIDRLDLNEDMEMMHYELSKILEEELSKPADEVDVALVDEILELMEVEAPTGEEQDACWTAIRKRMKKKHGHKFIRAMRNCAAVAAAIVVIFFASFETAKAFRWTFLLKLLAPVAETFGIYSSSNLETDPHALEATEGLTVYSFADTNYTQENFTSLEEMPAQKNGMQTVLKWTPERYEFTQGSLYEDNSLTKLVSVYQDGEDIMSFSATLYANDGDVTGYEYEKNPEEAVAELVFGMEVTYYKNLFDDRLSATWLDGNVHYIVNGNLDENEIRQIVENMLN